MRTWIWTSSSEFGTGTGGSGGATPVLGAAGPLRIGSTTASLRARLALGAAPLALFYGLAEAALPNTPFPGATFYVGSPLSLTIVGTTGLPGVPGEGELDISLVKSLPMAAGLTIYMQGVVIDPGVSSGYAMTNGLAMTIGL